MENEIKLLEDTGIIERNHHNGARNQKLRLKCGENFYIISIHSQSYGFQSYAKLYLENPNDKNNILITIVKPKRDYGIDISHQKNYKEQTFKPIIEEFKSIILQIHNKPLIDEKLFLNKDCEIRKEHWSGARSQHLLFKLKDELFKIHIYSETYSSQSFAKLYHISTKLPLIKEIYYKNPKKDFGIDISYKDNFSTQAFKPIIQKFIEKAKEYRNEIKERNEMKEKIGINKIYVIVSKEGIFQDVLTDVKELETKYKDMLIIEKDFFEQLPKIKQERKTNMKNKI